MWLKAHTDSHLNYHVVGWKKFMQTSLEEILLKPPHQKKKCWNEKNTSHSQISCQKKVQMKLETELAASLKLGDDS